MLEKIPSIVGEALKGIRPGLEATVSAHHFADVPETIAVDSPAFGHGAPMPADCTQDGRKVSPPLAWRNLPAGTAALVLVVEDADSPTPSPLVHAIVTGLPVGEGALREGALKSPGSAGEALALGKNFLPIGRLSAARSAVRPWATPLRLPGLRARCGRGGGARAWAQRDRGGDAGPRSGARPTHRDL